LNGTIINELASFQARTVISAKKLTTTIARINCRTIATTEDAGRAFKYIQEKFRIINNIFPDATSAKRLTGSSPTDREILEWLKGNYDTERIKVSEVTKNYIEIFKSKQTEDAVKRKLYRFLQKHGIKNEHNYFKLKVSK
jgi:DNA replicative helicase MCM subunit Mcm2 (Cdc46/Mcm family)